MRGPTRRGRLHCQAFPSRHCRVARAPLAAPRRHGGPRIVHALSRSILWRGARFLRNDPLELAARDGGAGMLLAKSKRSSQGGYHPGRSGWGTISLPTRSRVYVSRPASKLDPPDRLRTGAVSAICGRLQGRLKWQYSVCARTCAELLPPMRRCSRWARVRVLPAIEPANEPTTEPWWPSHRIVAPVRVSPTAYGFDLPAAMEAGAAHRPLDSIFYRSHPRARYRRGSRVFPVRSDAWRTTRCQGAKVLVVRCRPLRPLTARAGVGAPRSAHPARARALVLACFR